MAKLVALVAILTACGRIGFEPLGGDAPPLADAADAAIDAALGSWSTPTPVVLPIVGDDDDPTLTGDLLYLCFNRGGSQIFATRRTAIGQPWAVPVLVTELSTPASGTVPELFDDGLTIYFATGRAGGLGALDVWSATRPDRSSGWSSFAPVTELNTTANEYTGSVTADRLEMVLSSESAGTLDLLITTRGTPVGTWATPQRISGLATSAVEDEGFISADGLALYYTGPGLDLHVARRGSRAVPFPVGAPIVELNSAGADRDAWVSADARYIMFSSDRGGQFQLYEASR